MQEPRQEARVATDTCRSPLSGRLGRSDTQQATQQVSQTGKKSDLQRP